MTITPSLIVHGGAGTVAPGTEDEHVAGVRRAAGIGWQILAAGGTALDAIETAVRALEDDPSFDAGHGSYLNSTGHIEMDAFIMDGRTLDNGAVCAVQCIANPISLARLVMEKTPHALLAGTGAQEFAARMGIERLAEGDLLVESELHRWEEWVRTQDNSLLRPAKPGHGTVGAVARDAQGNIAAATSTGGTRNKLAGRVGDSPLIGSGGYADNQSGGVSATGLGETLMKVVISKTTCDFLAQGMTAQQAADAAIVRLADERVSGSGGVIVVDQDGRIGFAHNTIHLARAFIRPDGSIEAAI